MDLRDFGSTLARWWYLTLATLLVATLAAVGLYKSTGPTYEAESTVLLLPPDAVLIAAREDQRNYAPNNPLLYLSSLTDARDVLVRQLSSTDVSESLKKKAPGATITVSGDTTSGSPLILVKSAGSTEADALAGMKAVNDLVPSSLKTIQDQMDIAALQRIDSIKVTADSKGTPSNKNQIVMAAAGFLGASVLGLGLIALLDQLRTRRNRREGIVDERDLARQRRREEREELERRRELELREQPRPLTTPVATETTPAPASTNETTTSAQATGSTTAAAATGSRATSRKKNRGGRPQQERQDAPVEQAGTAQSSSEGSGARRASWLEDDEPVRPGDVDENLDVRTAEDPRA
ncbi:hypothetical protein [Luteococcus peritonei]|uniref:Capsular polysaccharide biosynthesis protein n=1 Tax=Luteococcus peritonei TaxID=88874 RepID=A0ABW4RSF9_9ACTN